MPNLKLTHDEILKWMCVFCFGKGDRGLTPELIEFIVGMICSAYNQNAEFIPASSCGSCRTRISKKRKFQPVDIQALIPELKMSKGPNAGIKN